MKKFNLVLSSLTLVGLLSFGGCSDDKNSSSQITSSTISDKHTVTLVLNNGEANKTRSVTHNQVMSEPIFEKQYYNNVGWYTDEACEAEMWNFAVDKVTEDITLYAKWEVNYEDWVWRLARKASKSTIELFVEHFKDAEFKQPSIDAHAGFGSGVIIYKEVVSENESYYYALTNNHVVSPSNEETKNMIKGLYTRITIYDHYLNPYTAELIATRNDYDLAIVKFSTIADSYFDLPFGSMLHPEAVDKDTEIKVAEFAAEDPKKGDNVASYGSPLAQPHVCTIGKVGFYGGGSIYDNPNSVSNVHGKEVIHHTASILEGNSGGPLFGVDLKLVGINYGSSGSNDSDYKSDDFWAVPINLVREFIDKHIVEPFGDTYAFLGDL